MVFVVGQHDFSAAPVGFGPLDCLCSNLASTNELYSMRGTCMLVPSDFKNQRPNRKVGSPNYAGIVFSAGPNKFTQHSFQVTLTDY
jgi:hypothetical protein